MASSLSFDSQRLPPARRPFSLSSNCLFASPASLSHWHPCGSTSPDDPAAAAVSTPLPHPQISGCNIPSAELSLVGGPHKRPLYPTFTMKEELFEDEGLDECIQHAEKRTRRLGVVQVKALEKAFELDNRLEPERKERLAKQLELQPRQVAIWFQNRRARWKTKQMEKDYQSLRKKLEYLKADRDKLMKEKEKLEAEVIRLKNDVKKRESMPLQAANEGGGVSHSAISSCVTAREHFEHAELASPSDQKDKDGSSTTYESDCSANDENVRTPSRVSVHMPGNVVRPGDKTVMQIDTFGLLDLPDFCNDKLACGSKAIEDAFNAEVESYSGFMPLDWWEAD